MAPKLVLLVEDNAHEREIYGKLLWYNGFDVICAQDAEQGYWLAHEAEPDLVVLDIGLPDVDGIELCRRLKSEPETRQIPVVALTGKPERDAGRAAARVGCARYLEKPMPPVEVLHIVERMIGRSQMV